MTIGHNKPLVIHVREKSCFCVHCIENNANIQQCQNIRDRFVSQWEMKQFVAMPPFEESDIVDIHDLIYSADYERLSDLVVSGTLAFFKNILTHFHVLCLIFN